MNRSRRGFPRHRRARRRDTELLQRAESRLIPFRDAVQRIGDATEVDFDSIDFFCEHATAAETIDPDQYHFEIVGDPGIDIRFRVTPQPHWTNHDRDMTTTMPAVNALLDIHKARPGILGLRDVGLPYAPMSLWLKGDAQVNT